MRPEPALRQDTVIGLVVAIAGIVILFWVIPSQTSRATAFGMPPALMPTVTISAALAVAVLHAVMSTLWPSSEPVTEDSEELPRLAGGLGFLLVFGCILLIGAAGLMIGGALTVAVFMLVMGERRPIRIIIVSVAAPGAIQLLLGSALRFA